MNKAMEGNTSPKLLPMQQPKRRQQIELPKRTSKYHENNGEKRLNHQSIGKREESKSTSLTEGEAREESAACARDAVGR